MNFLLDKAEHQEIPHPRLNSYADSTRRKAADVFNMENQPMLRCQMDCILQQSSANNSQTGEHITLKSANVATFLIDDGFLQHT